MNYTLVSRCDIISDAVVIILVHLRHRVCRVTFHPLSESEDFTRMLFDLAALGLKLTMSETNI